MKAVCDRAGLNAAFQMVQSVVNPRSPKPALQCVRISATKKQMQLLATDLEVGVRCTLAEGMQINEPGDILVPADRMGAILKELDAENVTLASEERNTTVTTEDSSFTLMGEDPSDYPEVPDFKKNGSAQVAAEKLQTMIRQTVFATAREAARYALNGVLWELRGKNIRLIATDGHRLAVGKGECKGDGGAGQVSAIVPTKAMHLIERSIDDTDTVELQLGEKELLVRAGPVVVYSRLIEGHFPKYEDVIPKDCDKRAQLSRAGFLSAVRRAGLLTNEESRGVRMTFSKDQLVLSSQAPEMGQARITTPVKFTGAEGEFEIAFNPLFVSDVLKVIESDEITLQMKSTNKPGLIREGQSYEHVIMPVNIL